MNSEQGPWLKKQNHYLPKALKFEKHNKISSTHHVNVIRTQSELLSKSLDLFPGILQRDLPRLPTNTRVEGSCLASLIQITKCWESWSGKITSKIVSPASFPISWNKSANGWTSSVSIFLKLKKRRATNWSNEQLNLKPEHRTQWFLIPEQCHKQCTPNLPWKWEG